MVTAGPAAGPRSDRPHPHEVCRGGSERRLRDMVEALPRIHPRHRGRHRIRSRSVGAPARCLRPRRASPSTGHEPAQDAALRSLTDHARRRVLGRGDAPVEGRRPRRIAARRAAIHPVVHSLSMADFGPGYRSSRAGSSAAGAPARILTDAYLVVGQDLALRFQRAGVPADKLHVVRSGLRLPSVGGDRVEARARAAASRPPVRSPVDPLRRKSRRPEGRDSLPTLLQQVIQLAPGTDRS